MKSHATYRFWAAYAELPESIQRLAQHQYRLFSNDPGHPSLRFKPVNQAKTVYSVRVGIGYRALGKIENGGADVVWFWIGSHSEYDKLIARS